MKIMLSMFQCWSLKKFPSNGESILTMAHHEVKEQEPQTGHRKGKRTKESNWKVKERESYSFLCMTVICGM